jgi:hypothetical protein
VWYDKNSEYNTPGWRMLNFVHTFNATKNESSDKDGSLAPSVTCTGTTEGTYAEATYISFEYNHRAKVHQLT